MKCIDAMLKQIRILYIYIHVLCKGEVLFLFPLRADSVHQRISLSESLFLQTAELRRGTAWAHFNKNVFLIPFPIQTFPIQAKTCLDHCRTLKQTYILVTLRAKPTEDSRSLGMTFQGSESLSGELYLYIYLYMASIIIAKEADN